MYLEIYDQFKYDYLTQDNSDSLEKVDLSNMPSKQEDREQFSFQSCSDDARQIAYDMYMSNPDNNQNYIKQDHFADYWKSIEERFECVGWCNLKYTSVFDLKEHVMGKYVFSNVNRGVVKYPGCLYMLTNWLPSLIGAIGGCLVFAAFVQSVNWFVAFTLLHKPLDDDPSSEKIEDNNKKKNKIPILL